MLLQFFGSTHITGCDGLNDEFPGFVMNENYFDYPLCMNSRMYCIVLRDPVERAFSQEKHLWRFIGIQIRETQQEGNNPQTQSQLKNLRGSAESIRHDWSECEIITLSGASVVETRF